MAGDLKYLVKSQITSVLAGIVDFGLLFFLTEVVGVHYVASTAIGALMGAITNFIANRVWAFDHGQHGAVAGQASKYALVSFLSLGLNVLGVYIITAHCGLKYGYSKSIIAIAVSLFWNYPLHRHYVFKEVTP